MSVKGANYRTQCYVSTFSFKGIHPYPIKSAILSNPSQDNMKIVYAFLRYYMVVLKRTVFLLSFPYIGQVLTI